MQPTTTTTTQPTSDVLFQHTSRPEWGLAILAWELDDKRGYQFEDGQLRVFKSDYFKLLEPVDRPIDESVRVLAELGRALGRERATKRLGATHAPIALADQVQYFSSLFPDGFEGAQWAKKHRGGDARSALKRHRDPVIQRASELFSSERLAAHVASGQADVIVGDMLRVIESTDLVSKSHAAGMERLDGAAAADVVGALAALMSDSTDVTTTFDAWVAALTRGLRRKPSWALATAFPALAQPDRFTAVKRTTFACAAAWLAPNLSIGERPTGRVYHRLLDMIETLTNKLVEAGLRPRDRMDVYDFVQVTLCPKAIKDIAARAGDPNDRPGDDGDHDDHDDHDNRTEHHDQSADHAAA